MRCPLCGSEFEPATLACHTSCVFNDACGIICCPNCGYQMPNESKSRLAGVLRRYFARRQAADDRLPPVRPLSALHAGQTGKIVAVSSTNHARAERLNVLGLTADALVKVEQKRPTYVLRIGFTELTIDREIADEIMVDVVT